MLKSLSLKLLFSLTSLILITSCATSSTEWHGDMSKHEANYMNSFEDFRGKICVPKAESLFEEYLRAYRGQGYWIPELKDDVDVETIKTLLPEMEKKLSWIKNEEQKLKKHKLAGTAVTQDIRHILRQLLNLKKAELSVDEKVKVQSRQKSLRLITELQKKFDQLTHKVSYLTNFQFPVDHLKNRKVHDSYREKEDDQSVQVANYAFLYRKILEDGAYNKDHTGSDIYLRTTIDTLYFEIRAHDFYLTEDARYDFDFVLSKIEAELGRGKEKLLERMQEWKERTERTLAFYKSLTGPDNQKTITVDGKKTTPNKELIKEHNLATERLKEFIYRKQAEVYNYWLHQPELVRAIFVLETILINEVGGVDGDDALERMDVARVVINRMDKPKYLSIGKKEFIYPYLKKVTSDFHIHNERWLNALFKQGEFSFTYYYMAGVAKIFCPDMSRNAKKLRNQNVQIALQVLKDGKNHFKSTRYFSRASMIGRIHMDSIWEDYFPYPERPGLLSDGQEKLRKSFENGEYTFLYSFRDPSSQVFQVIEINGKTYSLGESKGIKIFYSYRNPHYFRYFSKADL